jgi:phage baseplate assembly protein W
MASFRSGASNPPRNSVVYRDLPLNFISNPITKTIKPLKNEDAIKRAVRSLILTNKYERPYAPNYGGNITALLFENFTPALAVEIKERIKDIMTTYEPRAEVEAIDVTQNDDQNELRISIVFRPINQVDATELKFTVERIR